jgi:hypothetical protein
MAGLFSLISLLFHGNPEVQLSLTTYCPFTQSTIPKLTVSSRQSSKDLVSIMFLF